MFILCLCLCLCCTLTSENWVDISTSISIRPWTNIIGHFDPDLIQTYEKQYGGHFVCHLVYHWVEESWYRELSQICHSKCVYVLMLMLALVKTRVKVGSHIWDRCSYFRVGTKSYQLEHSQRKQANQCKLVLYPEQ